MKSVSTMSSLLKFGCVFLLVITCAVIPILTEDSNISEFRYCSGGVISSTEDKLDFLLSSRNTSQLILILVHNGTSCVWPTSNKGDQWNSYSITSNDKTVYIRKNGDIIKRYYNVVLQQITAKISSDDSSWKIWNVCGHGTVQPCNITCSMYEDDECERGGSCKKCSIYEKGHHEEKIKENSPNASGRNRLPLNIVVFLVFVAMCFL
ncbi:unnamed protein product [Tenebrio molitor]|nr:unnamed protein product [Tenebrio molitor]